MFKINDEVRIVRKFKDVPGYIEWANAMDVTIGCKGRIVEIQNQNPLYFLVKVENGWYWSYTPESLEPLHSFKIGKEVKCIAGVSKGVIGKIEHIGVLDGLGNENSIWSHFNNESLLSYLDKEILEVIENENR